MPDWQQVKAIATAAWEQPSAERVAYVTRACADDRGLAAEVLSLVAAMEAADDRFEEPLPLPLDDDVLPSCLEGRRLGAYEILSRIGAGGMGEVYKARDTRLDRLVAIKVLSARATTDPVSRERMEREARAVAALTHPHICTLHDIGSAPGLDFLVMEYLDGETLAARLARGALPIADALQYAEQIATALAEAHRAGIVHRDLKPANIMLTSAGSGSADVPHAKLLDFGVAKVRAVDIACGSRGPASEAPVDLTAMGFVPGTVLYMAPEQLERNATDPRTDVFAFGAVLFEMLTGRRAFDGTTRADVVAAILERETPRVSRLRPRVPAALDRIVRNCLARNPADRYQSVQDLLSDLRIVRRRLEPTSRIRMPALVSMMLVLALVGVAAGMVWVRRDAGPALSPSVIWLPGSDGVIGAAPLSPDGSNVVFSWAGEGVDNPELVLLRIGSATRVQLTNDPGVEEWPAWSPDGARIAFVRCGTGGCAIFTLPVAGGPEQKVRDLRDDRYLGLAWSPDGQWIAYAERPSASEPYALFLLSTENLVTRRLTTPHSGVGELRFAFSPDSRTLSVIRVAAEEIGVHLVSVQNGADRILLAGQHEWFGGIAWSPDARHLILSADQRGIRHLWKLSVAGGGLQQLAVAGEDSYYPSVSLRGGRMTFVHEFYDWDLWRMALEDGEARRMAPFPSSTRLDLDPAFSPDGRKLAFVSERGGTREVWISDADGTGAAQITSLGGPDTGKPSWSPDGRFLAFHANGINVLPVSGGPVRRISNDGEMPSWSVDGRWVYFRRAHRGRFHIWKVPTEGGSAVQVVPGDAAAAREEVDGRDLYFVRLGGGIWRRPVAGGPETEVIPGFKWSHPGYWTVSRDGIHYVVEELRPNEKAVYHLRFFDLMRRRTSHLGTLTGVLDDWVGGLTVSPDGRTLLYSQRSYHTSEVMLVENFR